MKGVVDQAKAVGVENVGKQLLVFRGKQAPPRLTPREVRDPIVESCA